MPEKPKEKSDKAEESEISPSEKPDSGDEDSWSQAQKERSYYYDDSHGYEIYNPDEDDDEDDE